MKIFRSFLLPASFCALILMYSCSREYPTRICESPSSIPCGVDSNGVNVRIINISGYPLCDFEVVYETNTGFVYKYGRLDPGTVSCYTVVNEPKVFPYVTFTLGNGKYKIRDTLKVDTLPYNNMKIETPGFYSFEVLIADSLNAELCETRYFKDK